MGWQDRLGLVSDEEVDAYLDCVVTRALSEGGAGTQSLDPELPGPPLSESPFIAEALREGEPRGQHPLSPPGSAGNESSPSPSLFADESGGVRDA